MSLSDVIDSFANVTMVVTRRAANTYDTGGVKVLGAALSTFPLTCSMQPATGQQRIVGGRDTRANEDGKQVDDNRVVYSKTELFTEDSRSGFAADRAVFENATWEVFRCEPWDLSGDQYWRVTFTALNQGST